MEIYKVQESDLIGQLEGFPIEVVQKMVERQFEQHGVCNVEVFQYDRTEDGFIWNDTPEKHYFWDEVIRRKDFDLFFEKYPKEKPTLEKYPPYTNKYKFCNHHHELTNRHSIVNFGTGDFVANNEAIPLLKALNSAGLKTRTHHYTGGGSGFVSILLDNVSLEIVTVNEIHSNRTCFNGKKELLIRWTSDNK